MDLSCLADMKVGSLSLFEVGQNNNTTPFFFIKENFRLLPLLGKTPRCVETKGKIIKTEMGSSLVVIFRFNQDNNLIYDEWFNYHIEGHREMLEELMFQQYFSFYIVDGEINEYTSFLCENQLKKLLKDYNKYSSDAYWNEDEIYNFSKITLTDYREKIRLFNDIKSYYMYK